MKLSDSKFLLMDRANPERLSGANTTAMVGRITYLMLFIGGRLDWPWLQELVIDPEGLSIIVALVSEGIYFLRRALTRIEGNQETS